MVPARLTEVQITGGFWQQRQKTNNHVTVSHVLDKCDETGRTGAFRLQWKPGDDQLIEFFDSDVVKALEAAAYVVQTENDIELRNRMDQVIDLIASAQEPDGYLNSYFQQIDPARKWTNLRDRHELYCAGHLIEAAVAHHEATGSTRFLDVACRFADHIDSLFGPAPEKKPGYPGHPEAELALVRLYRATGVRRYLDLAGFFVNQRGKSPHYYEAEALLRNEPPVPAGLSNWKHDKPFTYCQAHAPVREQTTAEGHAVRALYLYCGMADVAYETDDTTLVAACRTLWSNITHRRMYITGGVGSHRFGERFTVDYDLPNESAYAETCASIAMVFFGHRMLQLELKGEYGDVMERALLNGVLSGVGTDGSSFFYSNPLAYHRTASLVPDIQSIGERVPWFWCACCPPNIARLLASLGRYIYSLSPQDQPGTDGTSHNDEVTVAVHLYAESRFAFEASSPVTLNQQTNYPWDGDITLSIETEHPVSFTLALRIPGWVNQADAQLDGQPLRDCGALVDGYLYLRRTWNHGDTVALHLPMEPRRSYSRPEVRENGWQVAIERGPLVYCVEEADNGPELANLALAAGTKLVAEFREDLPGVAIVAGGLRRTPVATPDADPDVLYPARVRDEPVRITAVPYALWSNRGGGEMRVWMPESATPSKGD